MYVYIQSEKHLWTVGFYDPQELFQTDSDHDSKESAAKRVQGCVIDKEITISTPFVEILREVIRLLGPEPKDPPKETQ